LTPELAAARDMARKSIVLMKNVNGTLPLSKSLRTLAVIGSLADDAGSALGSWQSEGKPEDAISVLQGIRRALPSARVLFAKGAEVASEDTTGFADAVRLARQAEAVVLVLGEDREMSGESRNRSPLDLSGVQQRLAERISGTGRPLVVILMNGHPLATPWLDEHVPAILEAWFLLCRWVRPWPTCCSVTTTRAGSCRFRFRAR
jgi:beta-glucosidase